MKVTSQSSNSLLNCKKAITKRSRTSKKHQTIIRKLDMALFCTNEDNLIYTPEQSVSATADSISEPIVSQTTENTIDPPSIKLEVFDSSPGPNETSDDVSSVYSELTNEETNARVVKKKKVQRIPIKLELDSLRCPTETSDDVSSVYSELSSETNTKVAKKIKVLCIPARMSQLSLSACSEVAIPIKYNSNMARSFSEAKTPEEQRRRSKLSSRKSRAKMQALRTIHIKEAEDAQNLNDYLKQRVAATHLYAQLLLAQLNKQPFSYLEAWFAAQDMLEAEHCQESTEVSPE